jgi:hypothetical protein
MNHWRDNCFIFSTCGTYASLQVIFGMTESNISKWLRFSKCILLLALMGVKEAKTQMPSLSSIISGGYSS